MNQAISFDAYLNKNRPDRDTILTAARFIANRWVDFRTSDKIREGIQASAPNEPGLIGAVNSLNSDGDFLERFALAVLSVAWRDDHRLVEAAFDEAEGGLISKETTVPRHHRVDRLWPVDLAIERRPDAPLPEDSTKP